MNNFVRKKSVPLNFFLAVAAAKALCRRIKSKKVLQDTTSVFLLSFSKMNITAKMRILRTFSQETI